MRRAAAQGLDDQGGRIMGTMQSDVRRTLIESINELERLTDEIKVKLHLASMDARDTWEKLEPRLEEARQQAREATDSSQKAVRNIVQAFREFRQSL
jgi:hypothetical protein